MKTKVFLYVAPFAAAAVQSQEPIQGSTLPLSFSNLKGPPDEPAVVTLAEPVISLKDAAKKQVGKELGMLENTILDAYNRKCDEFTNSTTECDLEDNSTDAPSIAPLPEPSPAPVPEPSPAPVPEPSPAPLPEPSPAPLSEPLPAQEPEPFVKHEIEHNQVRPFAEVANPETPLEKACLKFKPQLHISHGCHSYPAVDWEGNTGGGLDAKGRPSAKCKGSGWGSQLYGRARLFKDKWAIMYSWYFPKDSPSPGFGHRHDWEHIVVWIDDPALENPTILAVSVSSHDGYAFRVPPPPENMDGPSVKVNYFSSWPKNHELDFTRRGGDLIDLITWEQMSEKARNALNSVSWGAANAPFTDGTFEHRLLRAWPFG